MFRKKLEDVVNGNGGQYRGNLTKEVTHLVVSTPSGDKYEHAKLWGIKTVSLEWLEQSLERGMILDESLYHPLLPASERGRNAWIRRTASLSSLGKRARDGDVAQNHSRKLRRTASAKLSSQNDGLWTDIVGSGFGSEERKGSAWDAQGSEVDLMAPDASQTRHDSAAALDPVRDNTAGLDKAADADVNPIAAALTAHRGLFWGKRFYLHGFNDKKVCNLGSKDERDADIRTSRLLFYRITCARTKHRSFRIFLSYSSCLLQLPATARMSSCLTLPPTATFPPRPIQCHSQPLSLICGSNAVCIVKKLCPQMPMSQTPLSVGFPSQVRPLCAPYL